MIKFLKGVFSEPDGTPSFSRIASGIIIACAIAWVTFIVLTKFVIPELSGLATLVGALYGANKLGNGLGGFLGKFGGRGGNGDKSPKVDDPDI